LVGSAIGQKPYRKTSGLRKYQIPLAANIRIALNFNELKTLWDYRYQTADQKELYYLGIEFFGFFAIGTHKLH
jgi:hypothetical protein